MNIFISIVFAAAIFTSLAAFTRIVSGAIFAAKNIPNSSLMGIHLAIGAPSLFWGLFYFLVS